jgi:hypothetical protein
VTDDPRLCYLHEDNELDHWIDPRERVGVLHHDGGVIQRDLPPIPASRLCAVRNGVEPERIVEGWDGPWR